EAQPHGGTVPGAIDPTRQADGPTTPGDHGHHLEHDPELSWFWSPGATRPGRPPAWPAFALHWSRHLRRSRGRPDALGPWLVGRPFHEPDHGQPRGQGPALPVHRRPARAP